MRIYIKLFIFIALLSLPLIAHASISTGLKVYYPFDNRDYFSTTKIIDRSGNGNFGTILGTATKNTGAIGQSMGFDGAATEVKLKEVNGLPLFSTSTPYSLSFWMQYTGAIPVPSQESVYSEGNSSNSEPIFSLESGNSLVNSMELFLRNDLTNVAGTESSGRPFDGKWHFIAFTDNNGAAIMYIDGKRDVIDYSYTPGTTTFTFNLSSIGALDRTGSGSATSGFFHGNLDDMRLYKRILSLQEVSDLYRLTNNTGTTTTKRTNDDWLSSLFKWLGTFI